VKQLLPVLAAGGTFAAAAVVGLLCGVIASEKWRLPFLAPLGLGLGAAIGAYSAFRLLARSMQ
jgi:hypothetical protein